MATVNDVIDKVDRLMPNRYTGDEKAGWVEEVEGQIALEIVGDTLWAGISDWDTPLLAQAPYDRLYGLYLQARMHYYNEEFDRYGNARTVANAAIDDFARWYRRTHTPSPVGGFLGVM